MIFEKRSKQAMVIEGRIVVTAVRCGGKEAVDRKGHGGASCGTGSVSDLDLGAVHTVYALIKPF